MVERYLINYEERGETRHPSGDFVHYQDYARLQEQVETLRKERDEARETNRRLNRRVQRWEGNETSFRLSFEGWSKVLFATKFDRANNVHDFVDWQRQIDKAWANGRAETAEAERDRLREALDKIAEADFEQSKSELHDFVTDIALAALQKESQP